jgi:hypothetical protein
MLAILSWGLASTAFGQLQWSSYNTSGVLVTTNVASGGDAGYGGNVTFTVPASTALVFVTKTFAPVSIATASSAEKINFTMNSSGGLYPGSTGRLLGFGLLNDVGAASEINDTGYWVDFNTGNPSFEFFYRLSTVATFFQYDSSHKLGSSTTTTGYPTNSTTYGMQFQLNMNSSANSVSIGTSKSAPYANAGAFMTNNAGVLQIGYSSGNSTATLATTTFNEFAFMFNNTSGSSVNITLGGITLAPANPEITGPLQSFSGAAGSTPTFTVVVNTNAVTPVGYQWYETNGSGVVALTDGATGNGSTISGSSTTSSTLFTNTLTFNNVQFADANGNIFVVITNAYGALTSAPVAMNILPPTQPTNLLVTPSSATVISGNGTNFTATCLASPTPLYYWYDNNNNLIQSGIGSTLALNNLQLANAGTYSVTASNYLGTASNNFTVTVIVPPCISQQPSNVLVNVGDPVNFYVAEGGCASPAPTYQWYKNGTLIPSATATNYSISSVALTDIANYTVVISNSAGSVTSAKAKLGIYSTTISGTPLLPANNGTGLCIDTYLEMSFNQTPSVGNSGKVHIYDASNPSTPVDTIDLSLNNNLNVQQHSSFSGDSQLINYYPIIITGSTATIYPHSGVLTTNKTYYVTIDPGVIVDPNGAYYPGTTNSTTWQFTTKSTGPANPTNLVVDASGNGDFVTVQGAVDSVPPGNSNYTLINVKNGNYVEIVDISGKSNITFRGQSRAGTFIGYPNNNNLNGTTAARMAFKVNGSDIKLENLTLTNGTAQGGSQAEALLVYNNGLRCVANNCDIASRQDTILINASTSQGYFYNCKVVGNYDYVWGVGVGFFTNCVLHTITNTTSSSYNLTAARTFTSGSYSTNTPWVNPNGTTYSANGFSFVNCTIEADSGVTGITLADANGTAGGLDSWVNCLMDTNAYTSPSTALSNTYVFWQDNNKDITGTYPISFTNVQTIGVTNNDPRLLAALNMITWFYGWTPQMAPNVISQPVGATVTNGQFANFTVNATGVPDPTYQWYQNGVLIPGATATNYNIASAVRTNGGSYTVVVSNGSGSVTSLVATLTYNDTAPVVNPSTYSRPAGFPLIIIIAGDLATNWSDVDGDSLALTGSINSTNGASVSYDSTYVYYTNANNVTDQINYTVGDGFGGNTPGIINVLVGPPPTNAIAGAVLNNDGTVSLNFVGVPGYIYQVDAATNLTPPVIWTTISTNTADINGLWQVTDIDATDYPQRFYRSAYQP